MKLHQFIKDLLKTVAAILLKSGSQPALWMLFLVS